MCTNKFFESIINYMPMLALQPEIGDNMQFTDVLKFIKDHFSQTISRFGSTQQWLYLHQEKKEPVSTRMEK